MDAMVQQIRRDYQFFLDIMTERGLLIDANPLSIQETAVGIRTSWASTTGLSYLFTDYASVDQYVEMLNRREFSLCFSDGSLLQIDYYVVDGEITSHRLCYVPCPFNYSAADWEGFALSDIPSMMSSAELLRETRLASPIRFDFDAKFSDEKHAHAHLSINKQSCRIPAYGPVSLGHFFRFILRYFYEDEFDVSPWWSDVRPSLYSRTLGHPRPHEMHLESSVGFD